MCTARAPLIRSPPSQASYTRSSKPGGPLERELTPEPGSVLGCSQNHTPAPTAIVTPAVPPPNSSVIFCDSKDKHNYQKKLNFCWVYDCICNRTARRMATGARGPASPSGSPSQYRQPGARLQRMRACAETRSYGGE